MVFWTQLYKTWITLFSDDNLKMSPDNFDIKLEAVQQYGGLNPQLIIIYSVSFFFFWWFIYLFSSFISLLLFSFSLKRPTLHSFCCVTCFVILCSLCFEVIFFTLELCHIRLRSYVLCLYFCVLFCVSPAFVPLFIY